MYMTGDEVRALSRRLPEIINATDEELSFWMDEAFDVLNSYCQQDFVYERQVTKTVRATTGTLVYLPKVLSGEVTLADDCGNTFYSTTTSLNDGCRTSTTVELFPGNFVLGYYRYNQQYPGRGPHTLHVTGDWGFAPTSEGLLIDGVNSLKAAYEKHRVSTVAHNQADTLNPILSADASLVPTNTITVTSGFDLTSVAILLNELKGAINSHFGDFVVHVAADTNTSVLPDVTDVASAWALLVDLKGRFNAHISNLTYHIETDTANLVKASADLEGSVMPRQIRRAFLRLVQRIAIRDDAEDHRQINSPYSTETLGDGYSYDLNNGTLRNLLRPEEVHMLLPYVNRGRIVI
jgi:hypothetical protein